MSMRIGKLVGQILRLGICVFALWYVLHALSWSEFKHVLATAKWRWLLAALVALGPTTFLLGLRLKWLMEANHVHLTLRQAVSITFAGNFANFVLPGQTGGDVLKAVYAARFTHRRHEAATVVFFDRLLGLGCVILLSGTMLLTNWNDPAIALWGRPIAIGFAAAILAGALYFSDWFRRLIGWDRLIDRLPLSAHLRRIDQTVLIYREHRGCVLWCLILTCALQMWAIFSTYLTGVAIDMTGESQMRTLRVYLVYVPLCWMAGAVPISPQGLGVLEWAYTELLHKAARFGTPEGASLLSMLTRVMNLAWALPGVVFHFRLSRPQVAESARTANSAVPAGEPIHRGNG